MCINSSFVPVLESSRGGRNKVDLNIKEFGNPKKILIDDNNLELKLCNQIELACDVRKEDKEGAKHPHSAKSHYIRQIEKYTQIDTIDSLVVIIYHFRWGRENYFWPDKQHDAVRYIIVEHILDENPGKYTILIPQYDQNNELNIREEEVFAPPTNINGMYKFVGSL